MNQFRTPFDSLSHSIAESGFTFVALSLADMEAPTVACKFVGIRRMTPFCVDHDAIRNKGAEPVAGGVTPEHTRGQVQHGSTDVAKADGTDPEGTAKGKAFSVPGIPDAPDELCEAKWQQRVSWVLQQQSKMGKKMIRALQDNKTYRNPRFMEKVIKEERIAQYGTCFPKEMWDPESLPPGDFLKSLKRQLDEKVCFWPLSNDYVLLCVLVTRWTGATKVAWAALHWLVSLTVFSCQPYCQRARASLCTGCVFIRPALPTILVAVHTHATDGALEHANCPPETCALGHPVCQGL